MIHRRNKMLLGGAALLSLSAFANIAHAAESEAKYNIPPQSLGDALRAFGYQSGRTILFDTALTNSKTTRGLSAESDPETALGRLLSGTGLSYRRDGDVFAIITARNDGPARIAPKTTIAAAETVSGSAIDGLVVTAQKRREQIQDVPIAISAFSADALQAQKIEGGFDLLKAIPNVTFSKNNFSGYNFSIRGIGTKAVSVTTDPGVAVEFNDTPLLRNRLFEQEYFDVERVEVLRGPQGTLHGRNATAGVINVISSKPELDAFDGEIKGEVGNYHTKRLSGFINIPLIEDVLAVRFAGSQTSRDGYDYNEVTQNRINGRDLWSGRLSVGFEPTERLRADFIWERFDEDDNRARTGKQLCHHDAGPAAIGAQGGVQAVARGALSQGCLPGNLYDDAAFGTPNGLSIPFFMFMGAGTADLAGRTVIGYTEPPILSDGSFSPCMGPNFFDGPCIVRPLLPKDVYGGMMQPRDLRTIRSFKDPRYRASTDVFELNASYDVTPALTFTSQTAYVRDEVYSFQDYNRFNTVPIFGDSSGLYNLRYDEGAAAWVNESSPLQGLTPGGVYCDPQLGCSDTIAGFDISQAKSQQFSQEVRLQSTFDGPFNFSVGANYLQFKTLEDYYVLYNLLTITAQTFFNYSATYDGCDGGVFGDPASCVYIDPNPIESINGEGHNYFRSKNPYRLKSSAVFGEAYYEFSDALKLTAGLRYTDDQKTTTPVPTQALLAGGIAAGTVARGYPANPDLKQRWREWSGRIGLDWKVDLGFTDDTLLYAFLSRGYKGGGANPPSIGFAPAPPGETTPWAETLPFPATFDPEFVTAYELGAKNTLMGGALILNASAFYYDYKDYQVSKIVDRSAANENFDAEVWGLEFESVFAPTENLRLNATLGYQDTRIAKNEASLDLMDRTQGNPDWVVVKPFIQLASNCVAPRSRVEAIVAQNRENGFDGLLTELNGLLQLCGGSWLSYDAEYNSWIDGPNSGQGFLADLSNNELPNAPHWTVSLGAQYSWDLLDGKWSATVRGDAYWQSQSWARVYNSDPYDKLHGWYNSNFSFWLERPEDDLKIEIYAKNILDKTPITDAFLNSDDTALTTNVFVLDPRLIGLQITKGF